MKYPLTLISVVLYFLWLLGAPAELSANVIKIQGIDLRVNEFKTVENAGKQGMVTVFLSASCPCSQAHFDHLNELQKTFPQVAFVGVHSNKSISKKKALEFFSKYKINFPLIFDRDLIYANEYQALKTPHVFFHDSKGKLLFQGGATNSRNPKRARHFYLKEALSQFARGEKITTTEAKTVGCYIAR